MRPSLSPPALLAALLLFTSGCIVTRADLEREPFAGTVVPAAATTVIVDVLFAGDQEGDLDIVRLEPNEQAGRALVDSLSRWLGGAGYAVGHGMAGVGLSSDSLALYEAVGLSAGRTDSTYLHAGPLLVDASLAADPALYAAARQPELAPRAAAGTSARRVVAVLRVRGRSVPVETSVAQAALTGLLTLGRKADFDRSGLQAELFLLDAETGALVWARREAQQLQAPDVTAALALTRLLAGAVPAAGIPADTPTPISLGAP